MASQINEYELMSDHIAIILHSPENKVTKLSINWTGRPRFLRSFQQRNAHQFGLDMQDGPQNRDLVWQGSPARFV